MTDYKNLKNLPMTDSPMADFNQAVFSNQNNLALLHLGRVLTEMQESIDSLKEMDAKTTEKPTTSKGTAKKKTSSSKSSSKASSSSK